MTEAERATYRAQAEQGFCPPNASIGMRQAFDRPEATELRAKEIRRLLHEARELVAPAPAPRRR